MKRRARWVERGVLIIAVLASIATSRKGWTVEAKLPAASTKATLVTVEATQQPSLQMVDRFGNWAAPETVRAGTWPGTGVYFVPAGSQLQRVEVDGPCKQGLCAGECTIPDGVKVAVTSSVPVESWTLDDTSETSTVVLDPAQQSPMYEVKLLASRYPAALSVTTEPAGFEPAIHGGGDTFDLFFQKANSLAAPITVKFVVHAEIEGPCPSAGACTRPEGQEVRVLGITRTNSAP
jgi:hypothetical protein